MTGWSRKKPWWRSAGTLGLLAALALAPAARAAVDQLECQLNDDDFKPDSGNDPAKHCKKNEPADAACWQMLHILSELSTKMRAGVKDNCQKIEETKNNSAGVSGALNQLEAIERNIGYYNSLLKQYQAFDADLTKAIGFVNGKLPPTLLPHAGESPATIATLKTERDQLQAAAKDHAKLDRMNIGKTDQVSDAGNSKNHFAARNGARFIKMLREEKKKNADSRAKIQSHITGLEENKRKLAQIPNPRQPPPGATNTPSGGIADGLNMNTLMGLATAGMGLANMMKQQQAAQDQGLPAATSPTPGSANNPAEKAAAQVSKLEDGKSKGAPAVAATPAPEQEANPGPGPSVPSGGAFEDESDISASNPAPPMAPATSKAPGGGSPGGGNDSGGGTPRELSAALQPETHKEDEALQGIGGGGLGGPGGGGGMPSSPSSDPAVEAAEEGMKDLLNDMKDTVEGNTDGYGGETQAADGGIIEMDAEDLFPRVRAAHVRSLKQGRVLNGLGEKITPDSE